MTLTADQLGWAYTGNLNSRAHIAVVEAYQNRALCGVAIEHTQEVRPGGKLWCPKCVRIVRAEDIDPDEVGIENDLYN